MKWRLAKNPQYFAEQPLDPQKVGVWTVISGRWLNGPIFFTGNLNGDITTKFLGLFYNFIVLAFRLHNTMVFKIICLLLLVIPQVFPFCENYPPENSRDFWTTTCEKTQLYEITLPENPENLDIYLIIKNSNIGKLYRSAFPQNSRITKVYLTRNYITEILQDAFVGLEDITELQLDFNELRVITSEAFSPLINLEILNLANNKINSIEMYAFDGLTSLVEINLENNQLENVAGDIFFFQKNLQLLDLSGNPLTKFSGEKIPTMKALILAETPLQVFDTNLTHLRMEIFNLSFTNLNVVDFSFFPKVDKVYLTNSNVDTIKNLESLDASYVNLDYNNIKTISGSFSNVSYVILNFNKIEILTNTLFSDSAAIRFIDLGNNLISKIESNAFSGMDELQMLHLEYNNIAEIDPKLFVDLTDLKYLDLSHNKIENLPYGIFNNLIQLKVLNISDNKLKSLHENGLLSVISLEELVFHNNQISYLDLSTLMQYKSQLKTLSLNHNAWNCEFIAEFYVLLEKNYSVNMAGLSEEGENFHGVACSSKKKDFWEDTEMSKFFNEDFRKSNFFLYFEEDYKRSNFFKFLNRYGEARALKFISEQNTNINDNSINRLLVFSVILQSIIAILLVLHFWKRSR